MGLCDRSVGIGLAIFRRVTAAFGEFVGAEGNLFVLFVVELRVKSQNSLDSSPSTLHSYLVPTPTR